MSFQQAKRAFANGGEVESGVFLARLAKVFAHDFAHDDAEHPVQVVLNAPIARVAARMAAATGRGDVM